MPLYTGRNDLTTISLWRFEIKALKTDVQWNHGFPEPVDDSKQFWFQHVFPTLPLYNKTESVNAIKFTNQHRFM